MTTLTLRDAVEVVLDGYTLHPGAREILETAIAQEHSKPVRSCATCKYDSFDNGVDLPCKRCRFYRNWEPKP